ncbi:mediator of plasmid stability [Klebsiella pneumoniae]|nr:mediator of plasmid stability [Klebsiella pneumoniae]
MPDGQYSFYLHSDDRTDIAAMATISTISQPLRGEFIRTAATAGAVVYQVDARLPALIPVFFAGQLSAVRLCAVMALVSGTWSSLTGVSRDAIPTTNVEYQYGDLNLLAVHHALLNSGLEPQPVSLTVTLPLSEYYDGDCQRNEENIRRKRENLMRELVLNKGRAFTVTDVKVMPESLPAAFSRLAELKPGPAETTLIIDLGGTTLDAGVIVGQFDDISAVHGNPSVGVSQVTRAAAGALRAADSETSALIADTIIRNRNDRQYLQRVINDAGKIDEVRNKITEAITSLGARVTSELTAFRNVNRVFLVGGGASLIEEAIRQAWPLAPDRIEVIGDPQMALAREIALYNKED